jgi:hypothetical protein
MDKQIEYSFYHWGPFLYKTTLTDDELKNINMLCKKDEKKDCRDTLAGLIRHEYKIDEKKLFEILLPYLKSYLQAALNHYGLPNSGKLNLVSAWVNYMTKFESNPIHDHDGDLSFVIFTEVPDNLIKEINETVSNNSKPGAICFINDANTKKNFITAHNFTPEIKDLFIFPAALSHCVNSFKSEGERISVSGNVVIEK